MEVPDEIYNIAKPFFSDEEILSLYKTMLKETIGNNIYDTEDHIEIMIYAIQSLVKSKKKEFNGLASKIKNIGLSTRTIQRNLSAENTTYKQQLQKVQKLMAINYIKNYHIEIDEVAYLIGYSETSSFLRAFKKWTGQTITQFKENY